MRYYIIRNGNTINCTTVDLEFRFIVQTKSRVISKNIVRTINKKYSPILGAPRNMGIWVH
jgi:hypothetical protein